MTNYKINIISLLQERAIQYPDSTAYTFLKDGKIIGDSLSYQQLDKKVRAIALSLKSQVSPGTRVMLMYPQGLDFIAGFLACLYIGVIAIPVPAPEASRLKRVLPRIEAIAIDSQASLILTTSNLVSQVKEICTQVPQLHSIKLLLTDTIDQKKSPKLEKISSEDLAYLQYTSGSTSSPKGVMISHGNLMDNLASITKAHGYDNSSITATWIPYFHDYGLVNGLIQPLYAGIPCYLISPVTFIKRPIRWLETISHYRVTHSGAPNFAYDYCVGKIKLQELKDLDLSSWRVAHTGAEPIRPSTLKKFAQTFQPYGFKLGSFYPSYGLAEATLMVTTKKQNDSLVFLDVSAQDLANNKVIEVSEKQTEVANQTFTGCGYAYGDTKVIIVNPESFNKCSGNEVGEIWVSGKSVAKGYWNRPLETENKFQASLTDFPDNLFLRTGDLGFLKDGKLFVTGRLKDLIIIRGQNYYPQDIELTVQQSHWALILNGGAVFSVKLNGQECIVVVQEVEKNHHNKFNYEEVIQAIRRAVTAQHELQIYGVILIKRGSISKTSSGKIMRYTCKNKFLNQTFTNIIAADVRNSKSLCI